MLASGGPDASRARASQNKPIQAALPKFVGRRCRRNCAGFKTYFGPLHATGSIRPVAAPRCMARSPDQGGAQIGRSAEPASRDEQRNWRPADPEIGWPLCSGLKMLKVRSPSNAVLITTPSAPMDPDTRLSPIPWQQTNHNRSTAQFLVPSSAIRSSTRGCIEASTAGVAEPSALMVTSRQFGIGQSRTPSQRSHLGGSGWLEKLPRFSPCRVTPWRPFGSRQVCQVGRSTI
jgi:hypothetical protein